MGTKRNKSKRLSGNRNKQAVQVLNKVDLDLVALGEIEIPGNPIALSEDPKNITSANFGTKREPRQGGCYRFSGLTNTYSEILFKENYTDSFTICSYVKAKYPMDHYTNIFGIIKNSPSDSDFMIGQSLSTIQTYLFRLSITQEPYMINFGSPDLIDKWVHISVSWDKSRKSLKLYIDGKKIYDTTGIYNLTFNINGLQIGGLNSPSDVFAVVFVNRSLTELEISDLYNFSKVDNITAYYKCSENSGNICYDSSGNGNHGKIINAITLPPEDNPNSIHQYQDVYSFENESGFTDYRNKIITSIATTTVTQTPIGLDVTYGPGDLIKYTARSSPYLSENIRNLYLPIAFYGDKWIYEFELVTATDITGWYLYSPEKPATISVPYHIGNNIYRAEFATRSNDLRLVYNIGLRKDTFVVGEILQIRQRKIIGSNKLPFIPKNESILNTPFKDVFNIDLTYNGKVPGLVKLVKSPCFQYNGYGYVDCGNDSPDLINSISSYTFGTKIILNKSNSTITGIFGCFKNSGFDRWGICELNGYLNIINFDSTIINTGYLLPLNKVLDISVNYNIITSVITIKVFGVDNSKPVIKELLFSKVINNSNHSTILSNVSENKLLIGIFNIALIESLFNGMIWDCYIVKDDTIVSYYPLGEPIINASKHIYHDVAVFTGSNGKLKHGILKQGTKSNQGQQDITHYLQRGFNKFFDGYDISQYQDTIPTIGSLIPIFLDSVYEQDINNHIDINGISIQYKQDGNSFLDSGTKLRPYKYPALLNADTDGIWNGDIEFGRFKTQNPIQQKEYFGKGSDNLEINIFGISNQEIISMTGISNITTYLKNLTLVQDFKERKVRNIFQTAESQWLLKDKYWENLGRWENTAFIIIS